MGETSDPNCEDAKLAFIRAGIAEHMREVGGGNPMGFARPDALILEPLGAGCSNFNFKATCPENGVSRVIRVGSRPCERGTGSIQHEYNLLNVYGGYAESSQALAGIAPVPLHLGYNPTLKRHLSVMEFIPGESKDFNLLTDEEITHFAAAVSKIHKQQWPFFVQHNPFRNILTCDEALDDMLQTAVTESISYIAAHNPRFCDDANELITAGLERLLTERKEAKLAFANEGFSLVHHDINPGNVIWCDRKPVFIDWEYSCYNDPAQELSYIFINNHVNNYVKEKFLAKYDPPKGNFGIFERMQVYTLANLLDDICWARKEYYDALHPSDGHMPTQSIEFYHDTYTDRSMNLRNYLQAA